MAAHGSMLQELCNYFLLDEFMTNVWSINLQDRVLEADFYESELSDVYFLDTSFWITDDNPCDGGHVFKLFGSYSASTAEEVRSSMISYIETHTEYFENVAKVPLLMNMRTLDSWIEFMSHRGIRADKISLLALGIIYHRHVLVITKNRPWCTVNVNCIKQDFDLYDHCSTHLLYMGHNMFGELKRKENPLPALYLVAEFPLSQRAKNLQSNLESFCDVVDQYGKREQIPTTQAKQSEYVPKYGGSNYENLNMFFDNNVDPNDEHSSAASLGSNDLLDKASNLLGYSTPSLDNDIDNDTSGSNMDSFTPGDNESDVTPGSVIQSEDLSTNTPICNTNNNDNETGSTPGSSAIKSQSADTPVGNTVNSLVTPNSNTPDQTITSTPVSNDDGPKYQLSVTPGSNTAKPTITPTSNTSELIDGPTPGSNNDGPENQSTATPAGNTSKPTVKPTPGSNNDGPENQSTATPAGNTSEPIGHSLPVTHLSQ